MARVWRSRARWPLARIPWHGRRMLARSLFADDISLAEGEPRLADEPSLTSAERALIAGAVDKRRAEFATARALARQLFADHGREGAELLNDATRAPVWPEGLVGSISHTRGYCGVVVGSRARYRGTCR